MMAPPTMPMTNKAEARLENLDPTSFMPNGNIAGHITALEKPKAAMNPTASDPLLI